MVGAHLLLLLIVEVVAYATAARWAQTSWQWSFGAAIALFVCLYLGIRLVLLATQFLLTRSHGDPIPARLQVSPAASLRMYVQEVGGWILMFSMIQPFIVARRSAVPKSFRARTSPSPPVLLVHGLACNRGNWTVFASRLRGRGFDVFTIDYRPWYASIDAFPSQLGKAVDDVLAATGTHQLTVVAHSMGGLVTRAYIDRFGDARIARVITLGTPHHGTWMTRFGFTPNVRDMRWHGPWLTALAEREQRRSAAPYAKFTCIFTYHDNMVAPQRSAALPGAERIELSGVGHLSLVLTRRVFDRVASLL